MKRGAIEPLRGWTFVSVWVVLLTCGHAASREGLDGHFAFADQPLPVTGTIVSQRGLTRAGLVETAAGDGIRILSVQQGDAVHEQRVLVAVPPSPADPAAIRRCLPRQGARLLAGEPFTVLALGDSVTATGDYEAILARLMACATGNTQITTTARAYPGRSVDAAVRHWGRDVDGIQPHLVLVMYGLNDQAAGTPLDAYLGQMAWLVEHCRAQFDADVVLLMPTPHPQAPRDGDAVAGDALDYAVRTIGFGAALRTLGARLQVPVVDAFDAIWGVSGHTPTAAIRDLWTLYPPHYSKPYETLLETPGGGDMIHPNALGHLAIARAIWQTINGRGEPPPLAMTARTTWTDSGATVVLTVTNHAPARRVGRLHPAALRETGAVRWLGGDGSYDLAPGKTTAFRLLWSAVAAPADLLHFPGDAALSQDLANLGIVDFGPDGSRVYGVPAPWDDWPVPRRDRQVATDRAVVTWSDGHTETVALPTARSSGQLTVNDGRHLAAITYCRMGGVLTGEAVVDGDLAEWADQPWEHLGLPHQARWTGGPEDNRATPDECRLDWAFRAGGDGLYIVFRTESAITGDRFTLYFDPRPPAELGTYGPYYWVGGKVDADRLDVRAGETSSVKKGIATALGKTGGEIFVPYPVIGVDAFPAAGELGFSIHWMHTGPGGRTNLLWAEDGHPWNSRWYGVIRRVPAADCPRPYVVRVK